MRLKRYSICWVLMNDIPKHRLFQIRCRFKIVSNIFDKSDFIVAHLIHNMSIKCCSATLFSLFTFLCNAVNILFLFNKLFPHSSFNLSRVSLGFPSSLVAAISSISPVPLIVDVKSDLFFGGIAKYSSSSLRTIIACLRKRGF